MKPGFRHAGGLLTVLAAALAAAGSTPAPPPDPVAAEVTRWTAYVHDADPKDELVADVSQDALPLLTQASDALRDGRRFLALQRLAAIRSDLSAVAWVTGLPAAARQDPEAFEAEWRREGESMAADLAAPGAEVDAAVRPAALRALSEMARLQVRAYYSASLDYGRNTMPQYGLFYLGRARAERELVAFLRAQARNGAPPPPLHPLAAEIDALRGDLVAAYRPPASTDRHPDFIGASAALKEAHELDAAGLRYGALLRYLGAAQRVAALRPGGVPALDRAAATRQLAGLDRRLTDAHVDHSVGRLFLEIAEADLQAAAGSDVPVSTRAIVGDVLPRYFAALQPAATVPPPSATPGVTVTLVRWPYT